LVRRAQIIGWGMAVPEHIVTNDDISLLVDTSDDWIRSRTGIERRHIAQPTESTSVLAIRAAQEALDVADADPREIDLIILATASPDHSMPSTACQVQDALGATHAGAYDLNAGCSGFVYALASGHQAIASGDHDLVLVIGADTLSRVLDWTDRDTCVLFGDGAGAVLLRPGNGDTGVLSSVLGSDGSGADLLQVPAGGSKYPASEDTVSHKLHYLRMDGRQVYRFATRMLPRATEQAVARAGLKLSDIDLIIPHQANIKIIETAAKRLKLPLERFVVNLDEYGNTSAASIPIALCEALESGRVLPGSNLVLVGFGAGLTWAAATVRWGVSPELEHAPSWRNSWRWLIYRWARARSRLRHVARMAIVLLLRRARRRNK